jgi:hypothetical protein
MTALRFLPIAGCLVFLLPTQAIAAGPNARETARRYELAFARARAASTTAAKIPSFARQTGLACNVCHTSFPQLTAFGRRFKLAGYTLTTEQTINSGAGTPTLKLPQLPPPSVMVEGSFNRINKDLPDAQNNNASLPDELSVFLGGAITPNLGTFIQLTYEGTEGSIGLDNVDIRYARQGHLGSKSLLYGLTLNNNPTVQDVWNTTSAWGFPYASSPVAPTPAAATQIDGALGQASAGLGAYALWADLLYTEFSVYRSAPLGGPNPPDATSEGTLNGVAPYWRVTLQHNFGKLYAMAGTYGLHTSMWPTGVSGLEDKYTDLGLDGQLEYPAGPGTLVGHGTYIHEKQTLDATFDAGDAANPTNTLRTFRTDGSYIMHNGLGLTMGYFQTTGSADAGLYAPAAIEGSATGMPDSRGYISQLQYSPWLNTHVNLQYVMYSKFNGAGTDYDGSGRSASDNNTMYLMFWLAF